MTEKTMVLASFRAPLLIKRARVYLSFPSIPLRVWQCGEASGVRERQAKRAWWGWGTACCACVRSTAIPKLRRSSRLLVSHLWLHSTDLNESHILLFQFTMDIFLVSVYWLVEIETFKPCLKYSIGCALRVLCLSSVPNLSWLTSKRSLFD